MIDGKCLVTGGSGFIGSTLVDRLLKAGHQVIVYDNFSTGQLRFLESARESPNLAIIRADILDLATLTTSMLDVDIVFHLAANADVRFGSQHPRKDLEQNTIGTHNVLEAMRVNDVKKIVFSSTGAVYGEASVIPTPENVAFPRQTSLYSASKLAGEGLITAYSEAFEFQVFIFRFVSILGERYSHGHVFDFYKKLLANPNRLEVLGNGKQRKSYLHVNDCIDAILLVLECAQDRVNIFNLGNDEFCEVIDSVQWICNHLGLHPEIIFSGGERGWVGDNPFIFLDSSAARRLGWKPHYTIRESVLQTLEYLKSNKWLLEHRI